MASPEGEPRVAQVRTSTLTCTVLALFLTARHGQSPGKTSANSHCAPGACNRSLGIEAALNDTEVHRRGAIEIFHEC